MLREKSDNGTSFCYENSRFNLDIEIGGERKILHQVYATFLSGRTFES